MLMFYACWCLIIGCCDFLLYLQCVSVVVHNKCCFLELIYAYGKD